MGIYVKDIELPKDPDEMIELAIFGDGRTVKTGESWRSPVDGKCYYRPSEDMNTYSALTVPAHGRLIDADALPIDIEWEDILDAPTVIEAVVSEEELQREYEANVEYAQYCERYEPTYDPNTGAM